MIGRNGISAISKRHLLIHMLMGEMVSSKVPLLAGCSAATFSTPFVGDVAD
jgi:hypothetical protein